ncbi:hypothetical protein ACQPU1_08755 [Clostridium paraputrificum]|uniref:hypothetical protein n=1 Tax=Clostridium TaxID=1485 RepID=UPI003D328E95
MEEKMTIQDIIETMELDTEDITSYYHKPSESMVVITTEDLKMAEDEVNIDILEEWKVESVKQAKDFINNKQDYLEFPKENDYNEEGIMLNYVEFIKNDMLIYTKLKKIIQDDLNIRKFKDELYKLNLIDQWYEYRESKYIDVAKKWCEKHNIRM